jgi:DNA-binding GntR family transcriptional regulator
MKKDDKVLEAGPLESLFSGNATAKILDFLITFQEWDYSESEIANNAGVSTRTVQRELPKLERYRLVEQIRTVGKAKMYRLDKSWKSGFFLEKLALALAGTQIERMLPKEVREVKKQLSKVVKAQRI